LGFLLISPLAAVAEEVFPRLGRRPASTAAPPEFVVLTTPGKMTLRDA
jgi:hypothetical protein